MITKVRLSMRNGSVILGRVLTDNYNLYMDGDVDELMVRDFSASYKGANTPVSPEKRKEGLNLKRESIEIIQTF